MKELVIYYSRSGKTKVLAESIKEIRKAEIRRIEEIGRRDGILGALRSAFEAVLNLHSDLKPMDHTLSGYDTVYLGGPVWAGKMSPALNSYIQETEFKNSRVILFAASASARSQKIFRKIREIIQIKGGTVVETRIFPTKKKSEIDLRKDMEVFLQSLMKSGV